MRINFYTEFSKTTSKNADKIAVIDSEKSFSFKELQILENSYALALNEIIKNAKNKPIGVFLPKSFQAIASDIAIIHTANIYMNLDVKYPSERLKNIFNEIKPICIITNLKFADILREISLEIPLLIIDEIKENSSFNAKLDEKINTQIDTDPFCIINTSGSTGTPKGVVLNSRGFFDFVDCASERWGLSDDEIIGSLSPIIFDIFSFELCLLMSKSACIACIPENSNMFPVRILEFLQKNSVSFIFWVPTIMVNIANLNLLENFKLPSLKHIWFAGEVFPTKQLNIWYRNFKNAKFVNLYGPIEITLDCIWYEITHEMDENKPIPIGKACQNTNILLLNENDEEAKNGDEGEICVRGTGLAMGYYNNPQKTAKAFVQNPLNNAYIELIYRTGDIGVCDENGDIIFKGRKDTLIKHSGYRIELSEIEHIIINKLRLVKNACVVYNHNKKEITLIYENDSVLEAGFVRKELAKELPKYMIPTAFVRLDAMPLGATGKIDRALLNKEINKDIK